MANIHIAFAQWSRHLDLELPRPWQSRSLGLFAFSSARVQAFDDSATSFVAWNILMTGTGARDGPFLRLSNIPETGGLVRDLDKNAHPVNRIQIDHNRGPRSRSSRAGLFVIPVVATGQGVHTSSKSFAVLSQPPVKNHVIPNHGLSPEHGQTETSSPQFSRCDGRIRPKHPYHN